MKRNKITTLLLAAIMIIVAVPMMAVSASAAKKLSYPKSFISSARTSTSITLSWSAVKKADAYRVYMYNAESDEYEKYKDLTGLSLKIKKLKPDTTYKFKIAALVKSGNKYVVQKKSPKLAARTAQSNSIYAPKGLAGKAGQTYVQLAWDKISGASAYRVYILDPAYGYYKVVETVIGLNYTVKGLNSGTQYKFKITSLTYKNGAYEELGTSDEISVRTTDAVATYGTYVTEIPRT